jgi:hypothetical protein
MVEFAVAALTARSHGRVIDILLKLTFAGAPVGAIDTPHGVRPS